MNWLNPDTMKERLLYIEKIKFLNNTGFRVLIILHIVFFFLVLFISSRVEINIPGIDPRKLFQFPYVWNYVTWLASWFNLLFGIVIIVLTGNEFSFRTFRQQVINGTSRTGLFAGKLSVIGIIALYGLILTLISGLVTGFFFSDNIVTKDLFSNIYILSVYFLQTVAYMSVAFLFIILLKNTALAVVLFILYRILIEPVARAVFPLHVRYFFPMKSISGLTPAPKYFMIAGDDASMLSHGQNPMQLPGLPEQTEPGLLHFIIMSVLYTVFFLLISWSIMNRRDL